MGSNSVVTSDVHIFGTVQDGCSVSTDHCIFSPKVIRIDKIRSVIVPAPTQTQFKEKLYLVVCDVKSHGGMKEDYQCQHQR